MLWYQRVFLINLFVFPQYRFSCIRVLMQFLAPSISDRSNCKPAFVQNSKFPLKYVRRFWGEGGLSPPDLRLFGYTSTQFLTSPRYFWKRSIKITVKICLTKNTVSTKNVDALAELYEHVDDVDYYAAGMLEKARPGAILGHTFQCVVGEMFFRWKFGDRFYYEFGDQPGSFSLGNARLQSVNSTN